MSLVKTVPFQGTKEQEEKLLEKYIQTKHKVKNQRSMYNECSE